MNEEQTGRWPPSPVPRPTLPPPGFTPPKPVVDPPATATSAAVALGLAIASFLLLPLLAAIGALLVAARARRVIEESEGRLGGRRLVKAARVLAIANICLALLAIPLMAIAIPTVLGIRERSADRAVQSDLRVALTAQRVFFADQQRWTADTRVLHAIEPAVRYEPGEVPTRPEVVFVVVEGPIVGLSGRSSAGGCFYLLADAADSSVGYASDPSCGRVQDQEYGPAWN